MAPSSKPSPSPSGANGRPKLLQQADKLLVHPVRPDWMAYCPTMDLFAVVTEAWDLEVWRINGQKAFVVSRKNNRVVVDAVEWKGNGQSIAVAWSDGLMDIVAAETGKVLQKDIAARASPTGQTRRVDRIGWGLNFIDVSAVKSKISVPKGKRGLHQQKQQHLTLDSTEDAPLEGWDTVKDETSLDDFLSDRQPDPQTLDLAPNLPEILAMMDVEALLPRLPAFPVPPAGPFPGRMLPQKDTGEFGTQAQVDTIFHANHLKDQNSVDLLIRLMDDGSVHPSLYDSREAIDVHVPAEWGVQAKSKAWTSHPLSCSHSILMEMTPSSLPDETKGLAFVPLTLGFLPSAGVYLHLIASKTAQLQNLLNYVQQCLQRIQTFWKMSQELPSRFMMNASETLEEKGQGTLVENMYHLACTGHCPAAVKEWLVDQLAESGHKRWDHAVVTSLTKVLDLVHESLLPALDRCSIVISRLRGLAQYHGDSGWIFNAPVSDFSALQEILKSLRLLAHTVLQYAGDERRQFQMFSKWLRYEIDFEATEPGSQSREEMEGRDPGIDVGMLLSYIEVSLTQSLLKPYLQAESELGIDQEQNHPSSYEDTRKAIDLMAQGAISQVQSLCLEHVFNGLKTQCGTLFQRIAKWQAGSTHMDAGLWIEEGEVQRLDVRMVYECEKETLQEILTTPRKTVEGLYGDFSELRITPKDTASSKTAAPTTPKTPNTHTRAGSNGNSGPAAHPDDSMSTYIALISPRSKSLLRLHRLAYFSKITQLPQSLHSYATATLNFSPAEIIDLCFADDEALLVLVKIPAKGKRNGEEEDTYMILSLPYTATAVARNTTAAPATVSASASASPSGEFRLSYASLPAQALAPRIISPKSRIPKLSTSSPVPHAQTIPPESDGFQALIKHVFDPSFTPMKMVVNGRKKRRVVVVLEEERRRWVVLDLDFLREYEDGEGEEEEGKGDQGDEDGDGDVKMGGF